jgi:hypothetical protein
VKFALAIAAIAAVSACASSEEITYGTAGAIPGVPRDQITVGEVSGSALTRYRWIATTPNGDYACSTDTLRRNTFCSLVTSPEAQ